MLLSATKSELLVFALNVAVAAVLISLAALIVAAIARKSLTFQHNLLVSTVGLTIVCPILLVISMKTSWCVLEVSMEAPIESEASVARDVVPKQRLPISEPSGTDHVEITVSSPPSAASTPRQTNVPSVVTGTLPSHSSAFTNMLLGTMLIWFILAAALTLRLVRALYRLKRARRQLCETTDPRLRAAAATAQATACLPRRLRVYEVPDMAAPVSVGIWRPVIVMPQGLASVLDEAALLAVLLHETGHIARRDPAVAALQKLSQALFWWNPLLRSINGKIAALRELICDDFAVRHCGDGATLGRAIVQAAEWSTSSRKVSALTPMLLDQEAELEHRVVRLCQEGRRLSTAMSGKETAACATIMLVLVAGAMIPLLRCQQASAAAIAWDTSAAGATQDTPANPVAAPKTTERRDVRSAIDRGAAFLMQQQQADGSWAEVPGNPGGLSALCVWALLSSAVEPNHPNIRRALAYLRTLDEPERVYSTALQIMVYSAAESQEDQVRIKKLAHWLQQVQVVTNDGVFRRSGSWSYGDHIGRGDNSNTQFAVLALSEAERKGVRVDPLVAERLSMYFLSAQNKDGSWGYTPGEEGTGSTTCGAMASLAWAIEHCKDQETRDLCNTAIEGGRVWLTKNFSVRSNPPSGHWHYYYLNSLARAEAARPEPLVEHDWHAEATDLLLAQQDPAAGSWRGTSTVESNPLIATSFALLFLSRADRP